MRAWMQRRAWRPAGQAASGTVQRSAGTYHIYVRFLDGAGNASSQYLSAQTTLPANFQQVKQYNPFVRR